MSLVPIGLSIFLAEQLGILPSIFIRQRNIGGFIADATIEELHHDELVVTEHPVEQGAAITDHSYKKPATVVIRAGWSNSSEQSSGDPNFVEDIYASFLALQASRIPFDILTGKRAYTNMLMTALGTETTARTENALILTVECREIILVATQTVTVPNASSMAAPQETGATQNVGTVQAGPAGNFNSTAAAAATQ